MNSELEVIQQKTLTVPEQAKLIQVTDAPTYERAGEVLGQVKILRKEIDSYFDPIISRANAAHKEACAQKRRADEPLAQAEAMLKPQMIGYINEQKRKAEEEERRQREEARKKAEQEQLEAAMQAEAEGDKEAAEAIIQEPVYVPPVQVKAEIPRVSGFSIREQWVFEIMDEKKIPREYLIVDEVSIGKIVRAMKDKTAIPGIRAYNASSAAMRTK